MSIPFFWISLTTFICAALLYARSVWKQKSKKYFPSPPKKLVLGHLYALTENIPWITLTNWGKEYGDILQLNVGKKSIVVLNKADDAHIILEKRGAIHSDRPRSILHGEIGGLEHLLALARYGGDFRLLRKFTIQYFNSRDHVQMYPLLQEQLKIFLRNLSESPHNFVEHLDRLAAGTMVKSTYGYDIRSNDDPFVKLASDAFSSVFSLGLMGMTVVDILPILRYVPSWLPGMSLLRRAERAGELVGKMVEEPYQFVKTQRDLGSSGASMVDNLTNDCELENAGVLNERQEFLIKNAAGQIYGAGAETSTDLLHTFIFEMIHHPEVAKKAQAEIEAVIGKDQLPTLGDRLDLPYIDCIVKEVMRINPATPLGVPHASIQEDVYKGMVIEAGSIIISNIWAMTHDEQYFPDPDNFNPDRFLHKNKDRDLNKAVHQLNTYRPDDPAALIFGFGRRICPGRFIADASAWLAIANILAVFDIMPAIDPITGKNINLLSDLDWENGGQTAKLKAFEARIIPRSKKHLELIARE